MIPHLDVRSSRRHRLFRRAERVAAASCLVGLLGLAAVGLLTSQSKAVPVEARAGVGTEATAASTTPPRPERNETIDIDDMIERARRVAAGKADADILDGPTAVRLPSGREVAYTPPPIAPAEPQQTQTRAEVLVRELEVLRDAPVNVDPDDARAVARELAGATTTTAPPAKPKPSPDLSGLAVVGQVIAYALIAALVIGLIAVIVILIRNRRRNDDDTDTETTDTETADVIASGAGRRRTRTRADELEAAANAAATNGDYTEAVRLLHHAGLLRLDAAGLVTYRKGRTNGTYVRTLRRSDRDAAMLLRNLSRDVEDTWFGNDRAESAAYERAVRDWEQLKRTTLADADDDGGVLIASGAGHRAPDTVWPGWGND